MSSANTPHFAEVFCFGEVLWDLLPQGAKPGGAPMNVAYHVKQSGISSSIISRVGEDDLGKSLLEIIKGWKVSTPYVGTDTSYPTGTVLATLDENKEAHYDIVKDVAWDHIQVTEKTKAAVSQCKAFIYGSLASRHEVSGTSLLKLLPYAPFKVFDVNLRPPFYSLEILQPLLQYANLIKLNANELKTIMELMGEPYASEEKGITFLRSRFNTDEVLLTKGSKGACYYVGNHCYDFPIITVEVKDTIGSGDAFLAGFLAEKIRQSSPEQAMANAIALSAFVTAREGACPTYRWEELEMFKEKASNELMEKRVVNCF